MNDENEILKNDNIMIYNELNKTIHDKIDCLKYLNEYKKDNEILIEKYNKLVKKYNSNINETNEYVNMINNLSSTNVKLQVENKYLINNKNASMFKKIITDIAQAHEYELNVYDCTEFSTDLNKKLKNYGWDSNTEIVVVDCDSGMFEKEICKEYGGRHMIVKIEDVYVEATSGNIISPDDYKIYGIT